jgi:cystinosin
MTNGASDRINETAAIRVSDIDDENDSDTLRAPLISYDDTISSSNSNASGSSSIASGSSNTTTATTTTTTTTLTISSKIKSNLKAIINIYADQSGSCQSLIKGTSIVALIGIILGLIMPKNQQLPSPTYKCVSSIIGYMYFVSWSVSFYPQIITNYQNKSIDGFSTDTAILAVLNYVCYALYTTFFFWDETIRAEYKDQHGQDSEITVMSNDVAFALNALILSSVLFGQVIYYGGLVSQPLSKTCILILVATVVCSVIYGACVLLQVPGFLWIGFLYIMATVKVVLTIMTYIPQMILNFQRQSTKGYNIWNVIFDFSGGLLSLMQLYFDCVDMNNFEGLVGNWAKLVLSFITLIFDGIYFIQHYILYCDNNDDDDSNQIVNRESGISYDDTEGGYQYNQLGESKSNIDDNDSDGDRDEPISEFV